MKVSVISYDFVFVIRHVEFQIKFLQVTHI